MNRRETPAPMEFDLGDTTQAHGDFVCDGIDASEPNDCDHVFQYSTFTNDTRCIHCDRRPQR